ncbi:MAG TPA: hypothetical protein VHE36_02445 [Sphingomicrobium sp.]|nr:hypothetical protein [Sphingomicrobium sp.]
MPNAPHHDRESQLPLGLKREVIIGRGLLLDPDNLSMRCNLARILTVALHDDEGALDVLEPCFERVNTAPKIKHREADPDFVRIFDTPRFKTMPGKTKERLGIDSQAVRKRRSRNREAARRPGPDRFLRVAAQVKAGRHTLAIKRGAAGAGSSRSETDRTCSIEGS